MTLIAMSTYRSFAKMTKSAVIASLIAASAAPALAALPDFSPCYPGYQQCVPPGNHGWFWHGAWWAQRCQCWFGLLCCGVIQCPSGPGGPDEFVVYAASDSSGYDVEPVTSLPFLDLTRAADENIFVAFDLNKRTTDPTLVQFYLYNESHGYSQGTQPIFLGEEKYDSDLRFTMTFDRGAVGTDGTIVAHALYPDRVGVVAGAMLVRNVCRADTDMDGFVTGLDYDDFVIGFENGGTDADVDGDGFVSGIDYDLFTQAFETGC